MTQSPSLLKLSIFTAAVLVSTVASAGTLPAISVAGILMTESIIDGILNSFASVAGGIAATEAGHFLPSTEPQFVSLTNNDLTKAAGKAIASVIAVVAKKQDKDTHSKLDRLAKIAKDRWSEIANEQIEQKRYAEELKEINLKEFLTPTGENFTAETALDIDAWEKIINLLDEKDTENKQFFGNQANINPVTNSVVADELRLNFPKALREVLKEDFKKDGKAFAALTIQLLQETRKLLGKTSEDVSQVIQRLEQLETQLTGSAAQQQQLFTEIAAKIDSGFAEFCQRFGVVETNITQILQGLDEIKERLEDIKARLDKVLGSQPTSLTAEQWRDVCFIMFAEREQKTTTSFFDKIAGFTPNFDDIYVPLALVEKQVKPQAEANITPETGSAAYREKPTQEIETKISEDDFFDRVLRSGKSPKSQGRRIAIIGEPGAGKTTRLQKIAKWIFEENLGLPIWIDLRELGGKSIEQYLKETWLFKATGIESHWQGLIAQFNQQQVWLLLDGLDEMTALANSQELLKLQGWVSKARVIVSCRTNVWDGGSFGNSDYDLFRNQDFAPDQVPAFIRNWFEQAQHPQVGEFLLAKLAQPEHQRLADLIRNPLRLTLFCLNGLAYQEKGGLPETQAALYEAFVEQFYLANNAKNQPDLRTDKNQQRELNLVLAELSLWAMTGSSSRFLIRPSELSPELKQKLGGEDVNNWLVCRLGWLNCVGVDPQNRQQRVYGFYHATFQEYFAALGVRNGWCFFERNRIFDREWKQIILLWLGRKDVRDVQKEELIQALIEFEDECNSFYKYRAYFLAAAGIVEFKPSKYQEIVDEIVRWGFGDFDEEKQQWMGYLDSLAETAREVLKETDRGSAIASLVNLLATTENENIRSSAADSLGKIGMGNEKAIASLVNLLATTKDESTRWQAAFSLSEIGTGNPEAIASLVNLLATTEDESTRWQAADCLGKINPGNPEAIASLVNLLATTKDESTRWQAAYSLSEIGTGNPEVIAYFVNLLATTENENIRRQAADCLGEIGTGNPEAITYFVNLLATTENENIRRQAADSLGKINPGNQEAIAYFVNLLATTENENIHRQAAFSLSEIGTGNEQAITALVNLLTTTENESTRSHAAYSLSEIDPGNPEAITVLVNVVATTENESTRSFAAYGLGKIDPGNPEAIAVLVNLLATTDNENTRMQAASSLGKIDPGNPEAIAVLVNLLATTENENIRRQAASILRKIGTGNEQAITALVNLLATTDNENTRSQAAYSLGEIGTGNQEAIAALVNLPATTENENTRRCAADSLGKIIETNEQYAYIISQLQPHLSNETYQNNFDLFEQCYKILWQCAQNLPYHQFYQHWNQQPHPATLPLTQRLKNHPPLNQHKWLLIDGSKFIDRDNPALDIYDQMLAANYPESSQRLPETMQLFGFYWKQLQRNQTAPILIFYEDPAPPLPQGFSKVFVKALSRLGGNICVISNEVDLCVKTFAPSHPNLENEICRWIEEVDANN
ncbi:HEAT repeat domain-containing protein [Phormidium nigroviride]